MDHIKKVGEAAFDDALQEIYAFDRERDSARELLERIIEALFDEEEGDKPPA